MKHELTENDMKQIAHFIAQNFRGDNDTKIDVILKQYIGTFDHVLDFLEMHNTKS